jgi:hypothetical protein
LTSPQLAPSALRRAALSLHALEAHDRDWILGALPVEQGRALEPFLQELTAIGILPEGMPVDDLLAPEDSAAPMDLASLNPAQLVRLAQLLRDEPPAVAGALLCARAWPWCDQLARLMHSGSKAASVDLAGTTRVAPAFQAAVLHAVQRRVALTQQQGTRRRLWSRLVLALRARSHR